MTQSEWQNCSNPIPMLEYLNGLASDRKLRLFACACCRGIWHLLTDERSRRAIEIAERYADGQAGPRELAVARTQALQAADRGERQVGWAAYWAASQRMAACIENACHASAEAAARAAAQSARIAGANQAAAWTAAAAAGSQQQTAMLREIFGFVLERNSFNPSWRSVTAVSLAEAIYADQSFDYLPILADALEDAGCTSQAMLEHCRQPGRHVRGCWVVDWLLQQA